VLYNNVPNTKIITFLHLSHGTYSHTFIIILWAGVQPTLDPYAEAHVASGEFNWSTRRIRGQSRSGQIRWDEM